MKSLIKNFKTLGKAGIVIYLFFAVVILWSVMVYAIVTVVDPYSYKISANSVNNQITWYDNICVRMVNNFSNAVFVPKKTLDERTRFRTTYKPSQVTFTAATTPSCDNSTSYSCFNWIAIDQDTIHGTIDRRDCQWDCGVIALGCSYDTSECFPWPPPNCA